jgi:hypothetical protein
LRGGRIEVSIVSVGNMLSRNGSVAVRISSAVSRFVKSKRGWK